MSSLYYGYGAGRELRSLLHRMRYAEGKEFQLTMNVMNVMNVMNPPRLEASIGIALLLVEGRAFQMSFAPLLVRRSRELQGPSGFVWDTNFLAILSQHF